jgi:hypothetical protein
MGAYQAGGYTAVATMVLLVVLIVRRLLRSKRPAPVVETQAAAAPANSSFAWLHDPSVYEAQMAAVGTVHAAPTVPTLPLQPVGHRRRDVPGIRVLLVLTVVAAAAGAWWLFSHHSAKKTEPVSKTAISMSEVATGASLPEAFGTYSVIHHNGGDALAQHFVDQAISANRLPPVARSYTENGVSIALLAMTVEVSPSQRGHATKLERRFFHAVGLGLPPRLSPGSVGGAMRCADARDAEGSFCLWIDGSHGVWLAVIHRPSAVAADAMRSLLQALK